VFLLILFITNCTLVDGYIDYHKTVYINLLDLKRYHDYACETLDDAKNHDSKKIISMEKYEANEKGLNPCNICNP
jgi:hypothetical protein